ncbi:SufE family protein [Aquabacter spiritensis]|uniref:Cysteine desulfuration protein SufE n=1 Tax=Aquabacter spiritensis TaxID=933073 RepID=A0A4R3LMS1_9HYPH|nr:SufE family protein [Aquabacter spiritensis]TCT01690.1 cysteine desulfuration protein SufE [Aquabacter spiritensis]
MSDAAPDGLPGIEEIIENFALLEEWEDRYRYLIELGRTLAPMAEAVRRPENKVPGCVSQVWLAISLAPGPVLMVTGDSDAQIVRGLVAVLVALVSGRSPQAILAADPAAVFERLGLEAHLTPQRSNGFRSMVARVRADARAVLAAPV